MPGLTIRNVDDVRDVSMKKLAKKTTSRTEPLIIDGDKQKRGLGDDLVDDEDDDDHSLIQ